MNGRSGVIFKVKRPTLHEVKSWYFLYAAPALAWYPCNYGLWGAFVVAWRSGKAAKVALSINEEGYVKAFNFVTTQHRWAAALAIAWLVTIFPRQRYNSYCRIAKQRDFERNAVTGTAWPEDANAPLESSML